MKSARSVQRIIETLSEQHPHADTELHYRNAFELLVATVLSAQSTDQRVNQVTPALFVRYPTARALASASVADLEPLIHSSGFFRQKAKALLGIATALVATHDGEVPAEMSQLVALPGVGRKTANVVLGHALGVPGLPVDRHVLRVANRIGIAESDDPEVVEAQLCAALPPERWTLASDVQILHGRRIVVRSPCAINARYGTTASSIGRRSLHRSARNAAMIRERFERLVDEAVGLIPRRFRKHMRNLVLVVEDEPAPELLDEMEIEPPDSLYGLYRGTPLPERGAGFGNALPDIITLFQRPIEEDCEDEEEIRWVIGETLIHEVGHYFGLSEEEIEAIEERYWRGETPHDEGDEDDT